ncbi:MAG: GtrA family protein [Spirochaetales bacterium]|nr:GtrA family protein [Spirochaetales bacterium]
MSYFLKVALSSLFNVVLDFNYNIAYALTLSLVILYNFFYNVFVTFKVRGGLKGRFVRYVSFVIIFNGLDYLLVLLLNNILNLFQLSIFIVTGCLMIVKFFVFNKWVFHDQIGKNKEINSEINNSDPMF